MIQSIVNPQCLNRYSYCLNNPLKYTDPSGYEVVIDGISLNEMEDLLNSGNYLGMVNFANQHSKQLHGKVFQAWILLEKVAPALTKDLFNSPITTQIFIDKTLGFFSGIDGQNVNHQIHLNGSTLGDVKDMASVIAHESFHEMCQQNGFNYSIYEEAGCFSIGRHVNKMLGNHRFADAFFNTGMWDDLTPSRSIKWVDDYVKNADWLPGDWGPYKYSTVDGKKVLNPGYPDKSVGGYDAINALYVKYY